MFEEIGDDDFTVILGAFIIQNLIEMILKDMNQSTKQQYTSLLKSTIDSSINKSI